MKRIRVFVDFDPTNRDSSAAWKLQLQDGDKRICYDLDDLVVGITKEDASAKSGMEMLHKINAAVMKTMGKDCPDLSKGTWKSTPFMAWAWDEKRLT